MTISISIARCVVDEGATRGAGGPSALRSAIEAALRDRLRDREMGDLCRSSLALESVRTSIVLPHDASSLGAAIADAICEGLPQ